MSGELENVSPPDRLLLVAAVDVVGGLAMVIGTNTREPQVHLGFHGRLNHAEEEATYWVSMAPEDLIILITKQLPETIGQLLAWKREHP